MSTLEDLQSIVSEWLSLWNGNLDAASRIIAEDYTLHMTPMDRSDLCQYAGPRGLAEWIRQMHSAFVPLTFEVQVPALFGENLIGVRWLATGTYAGGMPGARAAVGTRVSFAGADFLRVQGGKIAEYWLSSDILDLRTQLQMTGL